jgi:hypothetical protein
MYRSCGFLAVTACSMTFATSSGEEEDDIFSILDLKWQGYLFQDSYDRQVRLTAD